MPYPYYNNQSFYQPPMPDNLTQMRQPFTAPQANSMIWVQGEVGARSYIVASGNTVPLWDSENQTVYIKSVDASGIPTMRILDYTERVASLKAQQASSTDFVTRSEFDALQAKIDTLLSDKKECE